MGLRKVTVLTEETSSYTPSNAEALYIECFGAGGGGGGASARGISGGGGAGAFSSVIIPSGSVNLAPYTVSIGAGGPGGLGAPTTEDFNTGSAGGDTWFDSASFCLAKGGVGGHGAAAPKGGAGGFANDGVGDQRSSGASGTVGFRYIDFSTHRQAQSGDGANGFFGGGGPGINSKIVDHPSARDGLAFGAGGSGASFGRGGSGSAGLIKVWEYGILNAGVIVSGAGSFWSPVAGVADHVREIIANRDFELIGPSLATAPIRIEFDGADGVLSNAGVGGAPLIELFNTGSDWEHTIFAVVKPYISHSTSIINYATEDLGSSGTVGIYLDSSGVFEYIVNSATFTGSVAAVSGTQVSASAGVWQSIAYTVGPDGLAKQKAYKNGVLVSTVSKSFDIRIIPVGDSINIVGNDPELFGAAFHEFTGSMAYLGWWPKELTPEEIAVVHDWVVTEGGFGGNIS
ncbi:hypothetical protein LCGC14_1707780 [marine sediment metagenome]|uniref:Glycine-rich domain-containing protein n=1 Tax=marine sediment metagenome TaxID=412755 RepID=A0A0F9JWI1_9ZZZZ